MPPYFTELRDRTNGMVPTKALAWIYDIASALNGSDVVKIGTGHGAGAIAAALGIRDADGAGRVFTLDRLCGGSRTCYGDRTANRAIVEANLARYRVDDTVRLLIDEADMIAEVLPEDTRIGLLILDADGRVDRDLINLWPLLCPTAQLVIDDYRGDVRRLRWSGDRARVDTKAWMTYGIVNCLVAAGVIEIVDRAGLTISATRGPVDMRDIPDLERRLRDVLAEQLGNVELSYARIRPPAAVRARHAMRTARAFAGRLLRR